MLILLFISVFAVSSIGGIVLLKPKSSGRTTSRALAIIAPKNHVEDDLGPARSNQSAWQRLSQRVGNLVERFHFARDLTMLIRHAGSQATVGSVVAASLLGAVVAYLGSYLFTHIAPINIAACLIGGCARYVLLKLQKARRMKRCAAGLPDAIDLLSRALRAGHSISSAIEIVADQSAEPLAGEFAIVFQHQKFGIPFRDAILELGERVPSKDLHFLITAMLVQRDTGGDLTEILDRTAHVIRDRLRIEGEIRTYTAQGRLTGWILSALPVLMLLLINILSPGYSTVLFHDPLGQMLLYGGAALIALGGFIISRIVKIKV